MSFNFSEAGSAAIADLEGGPETAQPATEEVQQAEEAKPEAPQETAGAEVEAAAEEAVEVEDAEQTEESVEASEEKEAEPSSTSPEEKEEPPLKFTMKWKGKRIEVTDPEELRTLAQQGYDYNQKMSKFNKERQSLQELQRELVRQRETDRANLKELLTNKDVLSLYLQRLEQQAGSPQNDEFLTAEQARQLAQRELQSALEAERQKAVQLEQRHQFEQQAGEMRNKFSTTIKDLAAKHAELSDVDGLEELVRREVAPQVLERIQEDPETDVPFEDVVELIRESVESRAAKERARLDRYTKTAVARAAKAKPKARPVPPGGSPVPVQSKQKQFKLGSRELMQAAIADMEAATKR